jgi:hypothetical protein
MPNAGPGYPPSTDRSITPRSDFGGDRASESTTLRGRVDRRPVGLGSIIGFFIGLMFVFILAAAVAQFAVRGDNREQAGEAPPAPAVTQGQTPAAPSPPADGNPAANTSRDAVTP